VVCLVAGTGFASAPHNDPHHRSSLRARVTMADGTDRRVTLQGVGCTESMCSRVRVRDTKADDVWLAATLPDADTDGQLGHWAAGRIREGIEASLAGLGVRFDVWTSEARLHDEGWVARAVARGETGLLCADRSPGCQSRNRRVHFLVRDSEPVQLSASPSR
jgi:hypothetical protein